MFRSILISALLAYAYAAPSASVPRLDGRIIGGVGVDIEDYPYQISLLFLSSHTCGGSIISNDWVLTAAHCVSGSSAALFSIRSGSSIRNSGGTVVSVSSINVHPNYDGWTLDNDIALLALGSSLSFGTGIAAIALPVENQDVPAGALSVVTGWGSLFEEGIAATQLQAVDVPIVSLEDCRRAYSVSLITDTMLCAGELGVGGRDACQGDSGGPLVLDGEVVGIVSWGFGCARPEFPGVYGSVPALRAYINEVTGI